MKLQNNSKIQIKQFNNLSDSCELKFIFEFVNSAIEFIELELYCNYRFKNIIFGVEWMAAFRDVAGVRLKPAVIKFKDAEAKETHKRTIIVQNIGVESKKIRFFPPSSKVRKLFLCAQYRELPLQSRII